MKHLRYDDDALDDNGVLRDGKSVRVGLMTADTASPGVFFTDTAQVGTFAALRPEQRVSDAQLATAEAHADAAYARSVAALNASRSAPAARSRVSDTEATILQDESYAQSVADLNAWRSR